MKLSQMQSQNTQSDKKLKQRVEELQDCSHDELMKKLEDEIRDQKLSGSFDYDAIVNSIEKIKIYLPKQTYENMRRIIENLK